MTTTSKQTRANNLLQRVALDTADVSEVRAFLRFVGDDYFNETHRAVIFSLVKDSDTRLERVNSLNRFCRAFLANRPDLPDKLLALFM